MKRKVAWVFCLNWDDPQLPVLVAGMDVVASQPLQKISGLLLCHLLDNVLQGDDQQMDSVKGGP